MRRLFSLLLMVLPMLAFAQSIEVKYFVYSKKRVAVGLIGREKGFILPGCQRQDVIV